MLVIELLWLSGTFSDSWDLPGSPGLIPGLNGVTNVGFLKPALAPGVALRGVIPSALLGGEDSPEEFDSAKAA